MEQPTVSSTMDQLNEVGNYLFDKATIASDWLAGAMTEDPVAQEYKKLAANMQYDLPDPIYNVDFNLNGSTLSVCHKQGYTFYSMKVVPFAKELFLPTAHKHTTYCNIRIASRLLDTGYVAFMGDGTTHRELFLESYDLYGHSQIVRSMKYCSDIYSVKMNAKRLLVATERYIFIQDVSDAKLLNKIDKMAPDYKGMMDLCVSDASIVVYPGDLRCGVVFVFDAIEGRHLHCISAHESDISALKLNAEGKLMATASVRGTVIRVFDVLKAERLYEFTHTLTRYTALHSLAFSDDSKWLCCSSDTRTVHVFSLAQAEIGRSAELQQHRKAEENKAKTQAQTWTQYFKKQVRQFIPEPILRETSYATGRLPVVGVDESAKTSCCMFQFEDRDYVAVASTEGYLFCFVVPPQSGYCTLHRQYRIGPLTEEENKERNPRSHTTRSNAQLMLFQMAMEDLDGKESNGGDVLESVPISSIDECLADCDNRNPSSSNPRTNSMH